MNELVDTLLREFGDKEYAHSYVQSHLLDKLALQVHTLRTRRHLSQTRLAELSGIPQGKLSKIETGDFESLSIRTLFKLAKAFDVAVDVKMQSFGDAITGITQLEADKLNVPARSDDLHAHRAVHQLRQNPAVLLSLQTVHHSNVTHKAMSSTTTTPSECV